MGEWLTATDILEIYGLSGLPLPAIGYVEDLDSLDDENWTKATKQIGARLQRCFKYHSSDQNIVPAGEFRVEWQEIPKQFEAGLRNINHYRFTENA